MAFLTQTNEGAEKVIVPLSRAAIFIGRDPQSNIYLEDDEVSKNHASIIFTGGAYVLRDNGSTNGSFVNGVKVTSQALSHGDEIRFGQYLFRIDLENPVPVVAAIAKGSLDRGGQSYRHVVEIEALKGHESSGYLRVMTDGHGAAPAHGVLPAAGFIAHLDEESRKNLSLCGTYLTARAGDALIEEGKSDGKLFFIISGTLEARAASLKNPLGTVRSGEWVGEVNIFDPEGAMCSVIATEPVQYWMITRGSLEKFMNEHRGGGGVLLIGLAANLGRRLRESTAKAAPPTKSLAVPAWILAGISILVAAGFFAAWQAEKKSAAIEIDELTSLLAGKESELEKVRGFLADELSQEKDNQTSNPAEVAAAPSQKIPPETKPPAPAPKAQPSVAQPASETKQPVSTAKVKADDRNVAEEVVIPPGFTHPSKVLITTPTRIPVKLDGSVTGSMVIPEGRELPVVGVSGQKVIVDLGESTTQIPMGNTNFREALVAEAAAIQAATPEPPNPVAVTKAPAPAVQQPTASPSPQAVVAGPATYEDLSGIVESLNILRVLGEVRDIKTASTSDKARYLRIQEPKWQRAAETAKTLLANEETSKTYRDWLTRIVAAAEMFKPARFNLLEAELQNLDKEWIQITVEESSKSQ